ncbi:unnamed protein product [Peniophora sp. CBMAI 1063]|nr:unnamed protein product [Peniophora sp. CBMAI 1063]
MYSPSQPARTVRDLPDEILRYIVLELPYVTHRGKADLTYRSLTQVCRWFRGVVIGTSERWAYDMRPYRGIDAWVFYLDLARQRQLHVHIREALSVELLHAIRKEAHRTSAISISKIHARLAGPILLAILPGASFGVLDLYGLKGELPPINAHHLSTLKIRKCRNINDKSLASSLKGCAQLRELVLHDLPSVHFQGSGQSSAVEAVKLLNYLQRLDIRNIGKSSPTSGMEPFISALKPSRDLRFHISDPKYKVLIALLKNMRHYIKGDLYLKMTGTTISLGSHKEDEPSCSFVLEGDLVYLPRAFSSLTELETGLSKVTVLDVVIMSSQETPKLEKRAWRDILRGLPNVTRLNISCHPDHRQSPNSSLLFHLFQCLAAPDTPTGRVFILSKLRHLSIDASIDENCVPVYDVEKVIYRFQAECTSLGEPSVTVEMTGFNDPESNNTKERLLLEAQAAGSGLDLLLVQGGHWITSEHNENERTKGKGTDLDQSVLASPSKTTPTDVSSSTSLPTSDPASSCRASPPSTSNPSPSVSPSGVSDSSDAKPVEEQDTSLHQNGDDVPPASHISQLTTGGEKPPPFVIEVEDNTEDSKAEQEKGEALKLAKRKVQTEETRRQALAAEPSRS